jgi:hypothetical protein
VRIFFDELIERHIFVRIHDLVASATSTGRLASRVQLSQGRFREENGGTVA